MGGPGRKNIQKEGATGSRSRTPISTHASNQLQVDASIVNGDGQPSPNITEGHVDSASKLCTCLNYLFLYTVLNQFNSLLCFFSFTRLFFWLGVFAF